ncbi:putative RNA-directed DNA polymerase from transposon X-element [Trichonephila clavipes]|nr:putative RNA-directed DNA polymerase from transposon X-element [Trichonephila clavipes]
MTSFISWNYHGLRTRPDDLKSIISTYQPACVALQEIFLKRTMTMRVRGYNCVRRDVDGDTSPTGGVCLFTSNLYPSTVVTLHTSLQAVAVRIHIHSLVTVCCVYLPPNDVVPQVDLNHLVSQLPAPFLFLGDFNGHSPLWGHDVTKSRGRQIEQLISDNCLCLLNNDEKTYFHAHTRTFHSLDLAICSPTLLPMLNFEVANDLHNSDHFPLLVSHVNGAGTRFRPPTYPYQIHDAQPMDSLNPCPDHELMLRKPNVDNIAANARFLLISLNKNEMSTTSPFAVHKALTGIGGEPKSVKKLRSGDLLIETSSAVQTQSFLLAKSFLDSPANITPHKSLNSSRGVISKPDLLTTSDAEILEGFSGQGVTQVRHSQTACRGQLTCSRCASVGHASSDCTLEQKCVNCSQPHSADSKLCPKWKIEKEIQTIKTNRNISYIEARKFITPQPSQTYAQVAKSITVNNSSQTDETITKIVCPPLKLLQPLITISKPIMSPSIPEVIKSSTSTQAELVPPTSSVTVASPSKSPPPNSVIDTAPITSNSLSISAASSSSTACSVLETTTTISHTIPATSQDANQTSKPSRKKRPPKNQSNTIKPKIEIKSAPHRPQKSGPTEYTTDEEDMIIYDVEDEPEPNPQYVFKYEWLHL